MSKNVRYEIFNLIKKFEEKKSFSNLILNEYLSNSDLSSKDKSLLTNIFYGVLEKRLMLDHILKHYSKIKLKKIDKDILIILKMAVYQIVFMEKIPDNAAVNEAVELTKKVKKKSAAGFVNAVLRSLIRNDKKTYITDEETVDMLSLKYSVNKDIIKLWKKAYGQAVLLKILESLFNKAKIHIRVNTLKNDAEDLKVKLENDNIKVTKTDLADALIIENISNIAENKLFKNGCFHIQSLSSQLCCKAVKPSPGDIVYDVCAAPGGKSFTMAQMMKNTGELFSFDKYEHKIKLINKDAKRLGINIIKASVKDSMVFDFEQCKKADVVLCDVPCSGLGEVKRKPEIKYKDVSDLKDLTDIQYKILCNASAAVKSGGTLVYSTCTLNPQENNEIADKFLTEYKDFKPVKIDVGRNISRNSFEPENQLTIFPFNGMDDGFFVAMFRKI